MRVSHSIAGMVIIFDPGSPLRPFALSLPLRNASPSSEGSVNFGQSYMLSYIMYGIVRVKRLEPPSDAP